MGFADEVGLGLGRFLVDSVDRTSVVAPSAWEVKSASGYFRGREGLFSALDTIRGHAARARSTSLQGRGRAFVVSVGEHPHCVSPAVPAPRGFEGHQRVSIQPSNGSIESCLDWFTVDLFVDPTDHIAAVTLDLWDP